jgi:hypothetical protein
MFRTRGYLASLAVGFLVVGLSPAAPAEGAAGSVPFPGGVADAAGKGAFVTNPKGGIDALDLETGKVLWQTAEASKPLAVSEKRLVAQAAVKGKANSVRVVVFDISDKGKRLLESDPVVFPDWVAVGLALGRSFTSSGRLDKGDLLLRWEARAWYAGGARPTPEIEQAARKHAKGVAKVSLESGKVEMLAEDKAPAEPTVKLPKELEKVTSHQYWTGSTWETKPLVVGKKVVALALEQETKQQKLLLKSWDLETAKAQEPVELLKGQSLWMQLQADGRYLFVHQAIPKEKLPEGDYAWWIFALETGKQVAKLPYDAGTREMTVLGPRLYYVVQGAGKPMRPGFDLTQPRTLKAVDLKTGKLLWEHAVEPHRTLPLPP